MSLTTLVRIDEEVTVDVDDDDIVSYVCGDPDMIDRILEGYNMEADVWADHFYDADAVKQEQMLASLRRVCPHLTIEFRK